MNFEVVKKTDEESGAEYFDVESTVFKDVTWSYPSYDKESAEELCDYLNLLTADLGLTKTLPEAVNVNDYSELDAFAKIINTKQAKLDELAVAVEHELACELEYLRKSNEWRLKPKAIQEEAELSKLPTEKQVQAFIDTKFANELNMWRIAKANTSLIRQQIGFIDDRISLEKYAVRQRFDK